MISKLRIGFIASVLATGGTSVSSDEDVGLATEFADGIRAFVVEACPAQAGVDDQMNAEIFAVLQAPMKSGMSDMAQRREATRKNAAVRGLSDIQKRAVAVTFVGAYGMVDQLSFMNVVTDSDHLATKTYLDEEERLRGKALTSLGLMECLWPSTQELQSLALNYSRSTIGDTDWGALARGLYESECTADFFVLSRQYLDTDFASVAPADREARAGALLLAHNPRTTPESVAERCEDFS